MTQLPQVEGIHPSFSHIGLLVRDRDKAAQFLLSIPGAEITATREVLFHKEQMLVGNPCNIRIHFVRIQGMDFEIIEPFDCPDAYMTQHIEQHGEGFHHLAYDFPSEEEHQKMLECLLSQGYEVVHACTVRDLLVHYVSATYDSHLTFELKSKRTSG